MSGALATAGTMTVEWIDPTRPATDYEVTSGPWTYAQWLCWKNVENATQYTPIANVARWSKQDHSATLSTVGGVL